MYPATSLRRGALRRFYHAPPRQHGAGSGSLRDANGVHFLILVHNRNSTASCCFNHLGLQWRMEALAWAGGRRRRPPRRWPRGRRWSQRRGPGGPASRRPCRGRPPGGRGPGQRLAGHHDWDVAIRARGEAGVHLGLGLREGRVQRPLPVRPGLHRRVVRPRRALLQLNPSQRARRRGWRRLHAEGHAWGTGSQRTTHRGLDVGEEVSERLLAGGGLREGLVAVAEGPVPGGEEEEEAELAGGDPGGEGPADGHEVLQALRHLEALYVEVPRVQKVVHPLLGPVVRLRLRAAC
jgi:hypothetical protein